VNFLNRVSWRFKDTLFPFPNRDSVNTCQPSVHPLQRLPQETQALSRQSCRSSGRSGPTIPQPRPGPTVRSGFKRLWWAARHVRWPVPSQPSGPGWLQWAAGGWWQSCGGPDTCAAPPLQQGRGTGHGNKGRPKIVVFSKDWNLNKVWNITELIYCKVMIVTNVVFIEVKANR
jgi:hypothetical protein